MKSLDFLYSRLKFIGLPLNFSWWILDIKEFTDSLNHFLVPINTKLSDAEITFGIECWIWLRPADYSTGRFARIMNADQYGGRCHDLLIPFVLSSFSRRSVFTA